MGVPELIAVSRKYGSTPGWVLGGGGNTSFKTAEDLYIKASGFSLATLDADGVVRMSREKLAEIWRAEYPSDPGAREKRALADLMAARQPGEEPKRPSVETLMHDAFPQAYVVHTHPTLVNGLTCALRGEQTCAEILPEAVWIPIVNPGYYLSRIIEEKLASFAEQNGTPAEIVIMQNHGLVVASDTLAGIDVLSERVVTAIKSATGAAPDTSPVAPDPAGETIRTLLEKRYASVTFGANSEMLRRIQSEQTFAEVAGSFSPDHIVYAGHAPLYVEFASDSSAGAIAVGLDAAVDEYTQKHGSSPKVIAVSGVGVFGCGATEKTARLALDLFQDAVEVAFYAASFGGVSFMPEEEVEFIRGWEVEAFRTQVSTQ
ncbi:MAG: class II aldolase [Spirochaetaceae bacterium]|nr:MAG: class II aldolase [Spirochaetaceae bacterium]